MARRLLLLSVLGLVAAAAALAGAGALDWVSVGFQVPLRGSVSVAVSGGQAVPALAPLGLLALAAVAAVLAISGWARRLFGAVLLVLAGLLVLAAVRVLGDEDRLVRTARSAGQLPARSVPDGTVALQPAGPALAIAGTLLLAAVGVTLLACGHRMPRMGARYRAPRPPRGSPPGAAPQGMSQSTPEGTPEGMEHDRQLWDRIDAGEDPTAPGDPR